MNTYWEDHKSDDYREIGWQWLEYSPVESMSEQELFKEVSWLTNISRVAEISAPWKILTYGSIDELRSKVIIFRRWFKDVSDRVKAIYDSEKEAEVGK